MGNGIEKLQSKQYVYNAPNLSQKFQKAYRDCLVKKYLKKLTTLKTIAVLIK